MYKSHSCRGLGLVPPSISEWVAVAAKVGFEAIDLPLRDLLEQGLQPLKIRQMLIANRLACGASPFPYDWRTSQKEFLATMAKLDHFLHFSQSIGVSRLYTRVEESVPVGQSRDYALSWHRQRLDQIAEKIGKYNISLGLEAIGVASFRAGKEPLMASLESVRTNLADLFERHDSLGLLVDAFHLHAAQENLHQALGPMLQTRIVGIHLADLPVAVPLEQIIDNQRALPGTSSTVPVRKTLQELAQMGCDAPVMIETVQSTQELKIAGFKEAMEIVFNSLRTVWPE